MTDPVGILAFGACIPQRRLQRQAVVAANAWFAPGLKGLAKGERAVCNWDEDSITLAVEAARDALTGHDRARLQQLWAASTTHPFADRHSAAVVASALNLPSTLSSLDVAGGQRAGTSALLMALRSSATSLVVAADTRKALAASPQELHYGDGAAAFVVGPGAPIATLLAAHSETVDFVHQYRMPDRDHDYAWEDRWVRDEGYLKIVPTAVAAVLQQAGVAPDAVAFFCMPGTLPRIAATVARRCGLPETAVRSNLADVCGDTGAAHALLMLAAALEDASPGDHVLVAGFGEGCDALLLQATPALAQVRCHRGVKGHLARRREDHNYLRHLAFGGMLRLERGMRAEADKATALSVQGRHREMLQGLMGGRCRRCGSFQYPSQRYCVNPECKALDSQDPAGFAEATGQVMSYTADSLTYSPDPPNHFGMVVFDQGGRLMMDFTEIDPATLDVGLPVRMVFRIKDIDAQRGFKRYFWKAAPL